MAEYKRYIIDKFHAKSLENNPLGGPTEREINIYLPPGYFDEGKRYPVIYFLHGYSGNNHSWTITYKDSKHRAIPWEVIPRKILKEIDMDRLTTFEKIDEEINSGNLTPFILVQPDGSLHEPHFEKRKGLNGEVLTKGSFYVNSPHTGNYMDYIVKDVINYVDSNYRTISNEENRALMGGSMGGYGTIYIAVHHPEKFIVAFALSPGNLGEEELLDWELRIPIYEKILGEKMGKEIGKSTWNDILDTNDLIFSKDNPLLPSIERAKNGSIKKYKEEAYQNWKKYDLNTIIRDNPESLKKINLIFNCEQNDEFGLAPCAKAIHETLKELDIKHEFELYEEPKAVLTPHILGIGYKILPAIKYCCQYF